MGAAAKEGFKSPIYRDVKKKKKKSQALSALKGISKSNGTIFPYPGALPCGRF